VHKGDTAVVQISSTLDQGADDGTILIAIIRIMGLQKLQDLLRI
jgi:hypothetical protein